MPEPLNAPRVLKDVEPAASEPAASEPASDLVDGLTTALARPNFRRDNSLAWPKADAQSNAQSNS